MSDDRRQSFEMKPGDLMAWKNERLKPASLRFDCGPYGTVEVILPINGRVRFTAGTQAPTIFLNDVEPDVVEGDKIVRLNDPE